MGSFLTPESENGTLDWLMEPKVTKKGNATVEIEGEIAADAFEKHRDGAAQHLGKDIELPGFRKGRAPAHLVAERVGEGRLLEEMAHRALVEALPKLFAEHKVDVIGKPAITITKLAPKNPLGFKLTASILPEVTLPDYAAIAQKHTSEKQEPVSISDKELEDAILDIRRRVKAMEENTSKSKNEKVKTGADELPELNDALVKKLGDFQNVEDFKKKLTEDIKRFKERQARDKRRIGTIDEIAKNTKVSVPDLLIDAELDKMVARFKDDVARVGATWDNYLQQIKKTEDDLRKEWRPDALKSATTQLVLNAIAKKENIKPDDKAVELEVSHLKSHLSAQAGHHDADPHGLEIYVRTLLTNELVFQFLEKQSVESSS